MPITNSAAEQEIQGIKIRPIEGRAGQQLLIMLEQALLPHGPLGKEKYFLKVNLNISLENLAVKKSALATRANITYSAVFSLIKKDDGRVLTTGKSRIVASFNILSQAYATLVSEENARKRIAREISTDISNKVRLYFKTK